MGAIPVGPGECPKITAARGHGMRERGQVVSLGGLEPETHRGTGVAGKTENCTISVGPGEDPQLMAARGCRMQVRGQLQAWGGWSLKHTGQASLACKTRSPVQVATLAESIHPPHCNVLGYTRAWAIVMLGLCHLSHLFGPAVHQFRTS